MTKLKSTLFYPQASIPHRSARVKGVTRVPSGFPGWLAHVRQWVTRYQLADAPLCVRVRNYKKGHCQSTNCGLDSNFTCPNCLKTYNAMQWSHRGLMSRRLWRLFVTLEANELSRLPSETIGVVSDALGRVWWGCERGVGSEYCLEGERVIFRHNKVE